MFLCLKLFEPHMRRQLPTLAFEACVLQSLICSFPPFMFRLKKFLKKEVKSKKSPFYWYSTNQSSQSHFHRLERAVRSEISELITVTVTLRTSLNELALFKRMKLAGCHCLTIPHHSSSKKESALSWLKWPSLYYISHIKLFIWCNLKPSQQNLRKFLIVLQHFGLRCSNNGLLKQKQEEYIFLPLWKDCVYQEKRALLKLSRGRIMRDGRCDSHVISSSVSLSPEHDRGYFRQ